MDKLLVEVYLPVVLQSYDVQIPADMQLSQITILIANALGQLTDYLYALGETPLLCDYTSGNILNINMTPQMAGLYNGSKLMLI